jgi:hypothetical protein
MVEKGTKGGTIGTIARQGAQGTTFGFGDELQDIVAALLAGTISPDLTIGQAWEEARKLSKEDLARDWKNAPVTSFASQVVGSLPMGLTKGAINAGNWIRGGGALAGVGKGAAVGAGYGGLAGLGAADDTLGDRLAGGATGAAFGGVVGGATSPLFRLGTPSSDLDFGKVAKKTTKAAQSKAEKALFEKLAARPDLRDQLMRAEALDAASKRTGIDLTLAEKIAQSPSDALLADQKILGQNPMTAGRMEAMYAARSGTPNQAGQIESVLQRQAQDLAGGLGSYDDVAAALIDKSGKAAGDITNELVAKSTPLYDGAFTKKVPPTNLKKLLKEQPIIDNAIKAAFKDERFSAQLKGKPINSIEVIDAAKRIIDEKIRAGLSPMNPFDTRAYKSAQGQLLKLADKYSPSYKDARAVYSGNPDALQMRGQIGALADVDPMQAQKVASQLFSGTQQNAEIAAKALGQDAPKAAAARIFNVMDTARGDPTSFASKIAPDARSMDMLRTYAGGNQLDETLNIINQAKIGEKFRFNSATQQLQETQKGMDAAANAGIDLLTGNRAGLLRKVAGIFGKSENDPQFYKEMGDLMLTDKGMDLLRRVSMGQQTAIQELQTVSPALRIGSNAMTASPVTRAAVGGGVTPSPFIQDAQGNQYNYPAQPDFSQDMDLLQPQSVPDFSQDMDLLQPQTNINEVQSQQMLPPVSAPMRVPDTFLDRVAMAESSGNPNARATTSSASGLYQFTDPTWKGMVKNYGAQTGITLADKNNPDKQKIMAELLTKENTNAYQNAGITPDETDLYMAHFLGAPSAVKARKNMNAVGAELFPSAAQANKNIFYKNGQPRTVEEIRSLLGSKIGA